ncbi:MAG: hypothetical protein APR63_00060 [Desulfuromonas sp. SDB]|nr:MAG: hypothetical protein APR63_00060 [Desulfuromonas sp. SDB]
MKRTVFVFLMFVLAAFSLQASVPQAEFKSAVIIEQGGVDGFESEIEISSEVNTPSNSTTIEDQSNSSHPPEVYAPYWADDLLVTNECPVHSGVSRLVFDYDLNGYLYVALLANHGTSDTIWIYRSTDRGYTWEKGWSLWFWSTDVNVISYDMRVEADTTNPNIYATAVYIHSGDTFAQFRRMKADSSEYAWYTFDTYDDIKWIEMDVTDEVDPCIYVCLTYDNTSYFTLRRHASIDGGATWSSSTNSTNQMTANGFDVCAGADGYAYIMNYFSTSNYIRVSRYDSYFGHWIDHIALGSDPNFCYPCLASARYASPPGNYIHAVYQSGTIDNSSTRCYEYVSSDGGATYTGPNFFILGDVHTVLPFVGCDRYGSNDEFVGVATRYWTNEDSIAFGYKYDQTVNWNNMGFKNQYRATTGITPQALYINVGLAGGGAIIYRQYASNNIWYDRTTHANAVEEIRVPVTNITYNHNQVMFSFSLPQQTSGKVEVFDLMGRNIKTLYQGDFQAGENSINWDYRADDVSSGNYIMLLTVPGKTISEKFSIIN